jgi:hypothetical protein
LISDISKGRERLARILSSITLNDSKENLRNANNTISQWFPTTYTGSSKAELERFINQEIKERKESILLYEALKNAKEENIISQTNNLRTILKYLK